MDINEEFSLNATKVQEDSYFPDGLGMSIGDVQALLAKQNETAVPKDDPVLLIVTILNAFMAENKAQQDKYMLALKHVYADLAKDFTEETMNTTEEVHRTLKKVSTEGLVKITERQTARITELQVQLRSTCIIIGLLVLLNIAAMFWS